MRSILFFLFLQSFLFNASGQQKISFLNKTGRQVWVQKFNILGKGSFPYVLDSVENKMQEISLYEGDPTILNVVVIPDKGPYGSADGIYYLFKANDTLLIQASENGKAVITHITSSVRSKELSVPLWLEKRVRITQFYTLFVTNPALLRKANTSTLKIRDRIIDSLVRPYMIAVKKLCTDENIDRETGQLYYNHFLGQLINYKLRQGYQVSPEMKKKILNYYNDSLVTWSKEMTCSDCRNIPSYNAALIEIYKLRFERLNAIARMDTMYSLASGYSRSLLLSHFVLENFENKNADKIMDHYKSLDIDPAYKAMVMDNYAVYKKQTSSEDKELAILMNSKKSTIGFNTLLSQLKGKIVYIDFWASWCKPCIAEIPYSHTLLKKLEDRDVAFVYISLDNDFESWKKSAETYDIRGQSYILTDPENNLLAKKIGLGPIPRYLILDKSGKIIRLDATRPSDSETYDLLLKLSGD